jgi:RNA polymerase-interacting CarD/CdnL/TRCF family regulator
MHLQVGDKVIHATYGPGEIARIEEKSINGSLVDCYVFQTGDLQLWIPVDKLQEHGLRKSDFQDGHR